MSFKDLISGKKKIIFILGGLFVLFAIFLATSIIYTERPQFCITCHIMDPYYASWEESTHQEVNCIECHYEPGLKAHVVGKINGLVEVAQYLTNRYSEKPTAKVSDASCLRPGCHTKENLLSRKLKFGNKVEFQHRTHLGRLTADIELRCTSCHSQLTHDKHIEVDRNTCFICHFKNLSPDDLYSQCLKCHNLTVESTEHKGYVEAGLACIECHTDVTIGDGKVSRQVCYFCHADKDKIIQIKDKKLMHKAHIYENKIDCISCHDFIKH